jgi:predicted DNA-binding protein (UPF0251 family)
MDETDRLYQTALNRLHRQSGSNRTFIKVFLRDFINNAVIKNTAKRVVLTAGERNSIRLLHRCGVSVADISNKYGVSRSTIYRAIKGWKFWVKNSKRIKGRKGKK